MIGEIIDEYLPIARPELFSPEALLKWREAVEDGFVKTFGKIPDPQEIQEAYRDKWRRHLASFDQSILAAAGMTLEDLLDARQHKLARKHGGRKQPQSKERVAMRRIVLLSFRDSDLSGATWGQTIAAAMSASDDAASKAAEKAKEQKIAKAKLQKAPDRKTITGWLRELHQCGCVSIAPPPTGKRGRPPKKKGTDKKE